MLSEKRPVSPPKIQNNIAKYYLEHSVPQGNVVVQGLFLSVIKCRYKCYQLNDGEKKIGPARRVSPCLPTSLFLFSSFHYPCCAAVFKGKITATQHKPRMEHTQAADVTLLFGYIRAVLMRRPQTGKTTHLHTHTHKKHTRIMRTCA